MQLQLPPLITSLSQKPEERFEFLERIGEGSFAEVYCGFDKLAKIKVAIKIIDLEETDDEIEDILKEIKFLSGLYAEQLTRYFGSYIVGSNLWCGRGVRFKIIIT